MKPLAQNTLIQNRYLIVHLIGKGGMGEVYLAVDQRLGSAVALKRTYFAGDEMLGNAFEREARTLARMRHPVLPKVSDHFTENDEQYLVMEHIAGDDLAKRLELAQKPFPISWVMFWADQLLDALSYLHSHEPPIIHRDIKPQNLKLTDENHIILLDFGLSKTSTGQTHISTSGSTGSVVGYTPHYAPMEQIRGIGTNARSDLYSLSATLYQLMTNVVPADALSRADTMLNGMADPIEPPHVLNPEVPASVSEVTLKGMEVSQEKRFSTAREMQKALRRAFTQMQEAMAAQTVAFNMGDALPAEPAIFPGEKTQLMASDPTPPPVASANGTADSIDLDATLAYDPAEHTQGAAAMGTTSVADGGSVPELRDQAAPERESLRIPIAPDEDLSEPAADNGREYDSFATVVTGAPRPENATPEPASVVQPRPEKKGGRAVAIIGGLAALLVLSLGAAGAGWYVYNNYYASAALSEPSPSPSPAASPEEIPSPSPVAVVESNTSTEANVNTSTAEANSNIDFSERSGAAEESGRTEVNSSPARQPGVRPSPGRATSSPGARPTPRRQTNPGRTDILQ